MDRSSKSPSSEKVLKSVPSNEPKSPVRQIPNDKVKIYIRLRPSLNNEEWNHNLIITDQNTIKIVKSDLDITYMKFDNIFTSKVKQSDVFNNIDPSIQRFLEGENHSFFAYGQTGAGKTYTMIGEFEENNPFVPLPFLTSEHRGILPRALEKIIEYIRMKGKKCTLLASFFEVYNEKIYDLLNAKNTAKREDLELRESKDGSNKIIDLLKFEIKTAEDALQCLKVGFKNRITGCSHANTKSSRSHAIFQLILTQENPENPNQKLTSKLSIVDLAGSEKFKIPKILDPEERELHILELTSINGSLSTLGHCITALSDPKRIHIPFRNSKLTRVLSDSLTGSSKISFLVCLSPSMESAYESYSTLQFASRAKKIVLDGRQIKKKEEMVKNNLKLLNKSNNVIEIFKQICSDKSLVSSLVDPAMRSKIDLLEKEIRDLKMKNKDLQTQVIELQRSYSPDISTYNKKSTESLLSPYKSEDHKRSVSTNPSPSRHNVWRQSSYQEFEKNGRSARSVTRIPSMEKKVKHEVEHQDYSIFENMSIFKDMEADPNKKSLSAEHLKKIKEQRANYLKFWSDADQESEAPPSKSDPDKAMILDMMSLKGQAKTNLLAQKIREKEIERKYELFFSLEAKQQQQKQQNNRSSNADASLSMQAVTPANTTNKMTGPNNSLMSINPSHSQVYSQYGDLRVQSRNYVGQPPNTEIFNSIDVENEPVRGRTRFSQEANFLQGLTFEQNQSLFEPKPNQTIDEVTEEGLISAGKSLRQEVVFNLFGLCSDNTKRSLFGELEFEGKSGQSVPRSQKESNTSDFDIVREFDKKLLSVHQLNEQHQELIKNIGLKFGVWQQDSNRQSRAANSQVTKDGEGYFPFIQSNMDKKLLKSNSGRDITQVVKEIKQELSDALTQIQSLKLGEYNTAPDTLIQKDEKIENNEKNINKSGRSVERYTWEDSRTNWNPRMNLSKLYQKEKEDSYGSNSQSSSSSKSISDIIKKHWSNYKENVK